MLGVDEDRICPNVSSKMASEEVSLSIFEKISLDFQELDFFQAHTCVTWR